MADSNSAYHIKQLEGAQGYSAWATKMLDILTDQDNDKYVIGDSKTAPRVDSENPSVQQLAVFESLIDDIEFAITILTSLPDSWDNWVGGIDLNIVRNSEDIISRILQQAGRPHAKPDADDTALPAFGSKGKHSHNSGNRRDACFHCGRPGHRVNECRDKQNGTTYTEQEKQQNYDRTSRFKKRGNSGTSKANLAEEKNDSDVVFTANEHRGLTRDSWLLDSAASILFFLVHAVG
ncbi:hypothetical protein C8R45DRAFT_942041 [Mycena sanguinolenta]|nr:hypothetical protein C8R45DRAFT_942041 [Mycena sanguinolenta]